jgi:hypothetical protein
MQDDFFESTPWRGAADKRDTLFQDDDLELPLVGFLDAQTLKKGTTSLLCLTDYSVCIIFCLVLDADKGDDLFRSEPSPGMKRLIAFALRFVLEAQNISGPAEALHGCQVCSTPSAAAILTATLSASSRKLERAQVNGRSRPHRLRQAQSKWPRFREFLTCSFFFYSTHVTMQRSRAEEEGKWDAVSKAIQKVPLFLLLPKAV